MIALPSLGLAQDGPAPGVNPSTDTVFILNSLLFLIGGFLVFWMAAGFAMLEAGLVRGKNVTMQLTKNMALFSLAAIFYYLIGYNLMYPLGTWSIEGVLSGVWGPGVLEAVGVTADAADDYSYASTGSDFFFQLMFCAATASIVSGALAERIKLWPFLFFVIVLTAVIYPLQASWKWGGGFLDEMGFLDFAGSTVVHSVGGWAALAGALILGPRIGKYKDGRVVPMPGSNLALATLGTFILWLGWFGFNGGSQLAMGSVGDVADVSRIFANTNAAAAGGAVAALILTQLALQEARPHNDPERRAGRSGLDHRRAAYADPGVGHADRCRWRRRSWSSPCPSSTSLRSTTWLARSRCTFSPVSGARSRWSSRTPTPRFGVQLYSILVVRHLRFRRPRAFCGSS